MVMNSMFRCITVGIAGAVMLVPYGRDHQVHLVDVQQLGIQAGYLRAGALVGPYTTNSTLRRSARPWR